MRVILINSPKYGIKEVFVDDEDYENVKKHTWHINKGRNTFYAATNMSRLSGGFQNCHLHRFIMNSDKGTFCDHIDGNGLNNQKSNLRFCTRSQNAINKVKLGGASEFTGVTIMRASNRYGKKYIYWGARIVVDGKRKNLLRFPFTKEGEIAAAKSYDEAAKKYYGEFANLNFKNV